MGDNVMKLYAKIDDTDSDFVNFYYVFAAKQRRFASTHMECLDEDIAEAILGWNKHTPLVLELKTD